MASDPKQTPPPGAPPTQQRAQGIRIFTYPKLIFIFPTLVVSIICAVGMRLIHDDLTDPTKHAAATTTAVAATPETTASSPAPAGPEARKDVPAQGTAKGLTTVQKHQRFTTPQNLLGVLFLGVFAFNLLIMAIDFPRFTVVAGILLVGFVGFFIAWIGAYFDYELMRGVRWLMGTVYAVANSGFYLMVAVVLTLIFAIIWITRWLDYWEILPNEILHHHGPLSDLERFPTERLKFDKEIPDVLEFLFLGAGRLVLHVTEERKAIVMDNVLFINDKERKLKSMMSRIEVRVTTDQEVANP